MKLFYNAPPEVENISYAHPLDRGIDLQATTLEIKWVNNEPILLYKTGVRVFSEEDLTLRARSSISTKTNLYLANGIGTIDNGYTGELMFAFKLTGFVNLPYYVGGRHVDFADRVIEVQRFSHQFYVVEKHKEKIVNNWVYYVYEPFQRVGQLVVGSKGQAELIRCSDEEYNLLTQNLTRNEGGFGSTGV